MKVPLRLHLQNWRAGTSRFCHVPLWAVLPFRELILTLAPNLFIDSFLANIYSIAITRLCGYTQSCPLMADMPIRIQHCREEEGQMESQRFSFLKGLPANIQCTWCIIARIVRLILILKCYLSIKEPESRELSQEAEWVLCPRILGDSSQFPDGFFSNWQC